MLENTGNAFDNKEFAIGIVIDFQKAFNTGDHEIILDKIYSYTIRGIAPDWFSSYHSNRFWIVSYNSFESKPKKIASGISQGSMLGPLQFRLCMNVVPMFFVILAWVICWWYQPVLH